MIEPTRGAVLPRIREAWHARELLWFLTLRDLKVRYAQTVLGWLWAVVTRAVTVFTIALSRAGSVARELVDPSAGQVITTDRYKGFERASTFADPATRWPDFDPAMPPRPSVLVITKIGGGKIG